MIVHVLIQRTTLDLIWGRSNPALPFNSSALPVGGAHDVIALDHELVSLLIQRYPESATLDDAIRRLLEA
jgi:hypothetical protein